MNYLSTLVLVRHGETVLNKARKEQAFIPDDCPKLASLPDHLVTLTMEGERQAFETGLALRRKFGLFDSVVDSGYVRTIETRRLLLESYTSLEKRAMKVSHDLLIRERERGYNFNMTRSQSEQAFPWLEEYIKVTGDFYARMPGGESHADLCLRVGLFLEKLHQNSAGKKVLVVAHGHTIRAFRFCLEGLCPSQYEKLISNGSVSNCGVYAYKFSAKGEAKPLLVNQVYWR